MPELTLRAVAVGVGVGVVLAAGNLYMGMKVGVWDPGYMTAAILGFVLLARGGVKPPEHNVMVSTAAATSSMPSVTGFLGAVPALALLGAAPAGVTLTIWSLVLGVTGVLLAVVLRPVLVEQLPFPTGRATAEVISAGGQPGQARALVLGALIASAITWLRDGVPRLVPAAISVVSLSPLLVGTGVLMGWRTGVEMLAGAAVCVILDRPAEWLLWPGVGLVTGGGLTALALEWRSFLQLGDTLRALRSRGGIAVTLGCAVAVVAVAVIGLRVPPLTAIVGAVVAVPLVGVFMRAYGQTDIAHFGALGQAAQAALAIGTPGAATANVAASAIAAGSAAQTAALCTTFKVASLVGGKPGPLVPAQLAGVLAGAAVTVPAYIVLDRAYHVGSAALPVPFAQGFRAMGLVAEEGAAALPPGALLATLVAIAVGVALTVASKTRAGRFLPSPIAAGMAFLMPLPAIVTLAIGGVAGALARRVPHLTSLAAGAIAGESVLGVIIAMLIVLGLIPPP